MLFDAKTVKDDIVQWIRDFFEKNGRNAFAIVGISGGKDSSTTAALCVQALGKDRVYGVLMPQGVQDDIDVSKALVAHLGLEHSIINIKSSVDSLFDSICSGGLTVNRPATVNTPARIRMATLYATAAVMGGFVVNTCNLSEDWVGYSTKFGDGAGDLAPLAGLTVTEVKAVGRALGLPESFIEKVPQDGLSGLSDEENLGFTYAVLDKYIREGICEDAALKEKIDRLHQANLHKVCFMPCYSSHNPEK
jgi:NAD+ synthase